MLRTRITLIRIGSYPLRLNFEPPRLHCELSRLSCKRPRILCEPLRLHVSLHGSILNLHSSIVSLHGSVVSLYSSRLFTLMQTWMTDGHPDLDFTLTRIWIRLAKMMRIWIRYTGFQCAAYKCHNPLLHTGSVLDSGVDPDHKICQLFSWPV
jgi:hypothetical protein